jgi:glucose-6-phosphate dehydrogenase assembly protein OpcA
MSGHPPAGTGHTFTAAGGADPRRRPAEVGEPTLRWRSQAHSLDEIERELARIWAEPNLTTMVDGTPGRHVAARTSVMNLLVVARRPETAERCAATIQALTGRHPSRTIVVIPADPDGPSWLDAQITAHCILPRDDAPEVCAETIYLAAGGESGRHLDAIVAPLLIHDLPVAIWWPGDPPFGRPAATGLLGMADRLIVDGSSWSDNGLARLRRMAELTSDRRLAIFDIALVRQARWREAIASIFDMPDFRPYLRSLRRIAVTYATHDESGDPTVTNVVKPIYHVAWLASRLGLSVARPLAVVAAPPGPRRPQARAAGRAAVPVARGFAATLRGGRRDIDVVVRPVSSPMPSGTTLRVELRAERRGSELRADVTAEQETVRVHVWQDGVAALERAFQAPRRTEGDLLAEAIEAGARDTVALDAIRTAAALIGPSGDERDGTPATRTRGGTLTA